MTNRRPREFDADIPSQFAAFRFSPATSPMASAHLAKPRKKLKNPSGTGDQSDHFQRKRMPPPRDIGWQRRRLKSCPEPRVQLGAEQDPHIPSTATNWLHNPDNPAQNPAAQDTGRRDTPHKER
jgi:hypothetical protein